MPLLGELLALSCAFVWSCAVILFKKTLDLGNVSVVGVNLFKNSVAVLLLGITLVVLQIPIDFNRPAAEWWALAISAALGLALADSFLFASLERIGPGLLAIIELVAAPFQVLLAWLFLSETLSVPVLLAACLVLVGLVVAGSEDAAKERRASGPTSVAGAEVRKRRRAGVAYIVIAMALMSVGIILAKEPLERGNLVEVTFVRLVFGNLALLGWTAFRSDGRSVLAPFTDPRIRRALLPASVVGTYISMLLWLGGFKYGDVAVVSVLNQMSTVFTLILARVVLGEVITSRRALGSAVALVGAVTIIVLRL
jgi:drug/metabolite transporter (DMT)-like permease